jgi:PAS domain S-box-containing protein
MRTGTANMEISSQIASLRTLQSISTRLVSKSTPQALYTQILDAAIELMAADAASIQMLAADGLSLVLLGSKNLHPDSSAFLRRVDVGRGSADGRALRDNERVLVADIEACDFMAGTAVQQEYRRSGIRSVQSTPLRSRSGQLLGMLSTHWRAPHTPTEDDFGLFDVLARQAADLIERALAEDALRESEERFRQIANTAPVMIWMSDVEKQITYLNKTWLDYTGRPLDAALGHRWIEVLHPDEVERCRDAYVRAFDQRQPFQVEHRLRRHDGEYRWAVSAGVPRYNVDGSFTGYIGTAIDISERKLAEEVLSTASQRLIEAQEEERAYVARELHDDITQRLTLIGFRLDGLGEDTAPSVEELRQKIHDTREEVANLVKDVQALSHRLHPPSLDYLGIEAAAEGLCRDVSRDVEVSFHAENVPAGLSERISVCLYRVLQEALQNATKHSGARHVEVWLRGGADQIELTVHDSGPGFDPEEAFKGRGLGLTSMKKRLEAFNGQLSIDSKPQGGTTIRAHVPLPSIPSKFDAGATPPSTPNDGRARLVI